MSMNRIWMITVTACSLCIASFSVAQDESFEPDPKAAAAFEELLQHYRERPALTVRSTLEIELKQGDTTASSEEVTLEMTYAGNGRGVTKIRDFICTFGDGHYAVINEKTDHSYYREEYEGSVYWHLLATFHSLPYPHLGILWGEDAASDVWMQLQPDTAWIVPTSLGETTRDGKQLQVIGFESGEGGLKIFVDPDSFLIESIEHEVTGGMTVQPGTTKRTTYSFEYTTYDEPLAEEDWKFDPGDRQRVDVVAALLPPPEPREPAPGMPAGGGNALIGKEAPGFVLATMDGKAVDLEDLRGKVVVLDFWATWCLPCVQALPKLHEVAAWAKRESLPVAVYTVNVFEGNTLPADTPDARLERVSAFWKEHTFTLPVAMDYTDETAMSYGVRGIPTTVIIRSDGVIHELHSGAGGNFVERLQTDIKGAIDALEGREISDDE